MSNKFGSSSWLRIWVASAALAMLPLGVGNAQESPGAAPAAIPTRFPISESGNIPVGKKTPFTSYEAVVGALVPDLDATESKIKHVRVMGIKPFVPVYRAINREFGHRGLLHSLWG